MEQTLEEALMIGELVILDQIFLIFPNLNIVICRQIIWWGEFAFLDIFILLDNLYKINYTIKGTGNPRFFKEDISIFPGEHLVKNMSFLI